VSLVARPDQAELDKQGIRGAALSVEPNSDELAGIGGLIDEKKLKYLSRKRFPLSNAAKAQEQVADWSHARQDRS
jgi:hypothetical protein